MAEMSVEQRGKIEEKTVEQSAFVADADTMEAAYTSPPTSASRSMMFPSWGDLLAMLGIFLTAQLFVRIAVSLMGLENVTPQAMELLTGAQRRAAEFIMGENSFIMTIATLVLTLIFVIIYRHFRGGQARVIRCSIRGFNPTVLLWGLVTLISIAVVMEPIKQFLPQSSVPSGRGLYMILALVFVAPIFEEILCRGIIMESVRSKRGAWAACVISSLIFGIMHIDPQSMINAFVVGLLLGYLYLRTDSIFAPIIIHAINNVLAYLFLLFDWSQTTLFDLVGGGVTYAIIYCVCVALLVASIALMARNITKLDRGDKMK